jgi:hypothetical protein
MRNLIIALLFLSVTSCVTSKRCNEKYPAEVRIKDSIVIKDSTIITEKIVTKTNVKDSIVYTQAVKDSGEVDASENQTIKYKNDKVEVKIVVKDKIVKYYVDISATESRYQSRIDSISRELETYKYKDSTSIHSEQAIRPAVVLKLPWHTRLWQSTKDFFAFLGLLVVVIFLGRMAIRYFFKV